TASHLPCLERLDLEHVRLLAPVAGLALGEFARARPLGAAVGRHALGPELAGRVRGEVDHHAMAIEAAHAGPLVQLAVLVGMPELDADGALWKDCGGIAATPAAPRLHVRARRGTHVPTVTK